MKAYFTISINKMSQSFYAVAKGRAPGIYMTWADAKAQVDGFKFPKYRKFTTHEEAADFIKTNTPKTLDDLVEVETVVKNKDCDLVVFTDGSAIGNGRKDARAGYAVVWPNNPELTQAHKITEGAKTNNRAEFMAAILALELADQIDPTRKQKLHIYSDSMLLINTATKWRTTWKRNGWCKADGKEVMNRDLVERLDSLLTARPKVAWQHVEAHTGKSDYMSIWNAKADELAQKVVASK
jgi:ribonuclease HI